MSDGGWTSESLTETTYGPRGFTAAQVEVLLRAIRPARVHHAQGQSHVPAYDVVAHLTRIFGFGGWDKEIRSLDIVHQASHGVDLGATDNNGKAKPNQGRWWVTYSCLMRLTIKDQWGNVMMVTEDAATGSAQNAISPSDAFDFAIKNAVSYATKRCAKDLGDQFGLALYNKGSTKALVGRTLVLPDDWPDEPTTANDDEDLTAHVEPPQTMGNDEVDWEAVRAAAVEAGPDEDDADEDEEQASFLTGYSDYE